MRRYVFIAEFASPQEGPDCTPIAPFDKVEVVQGEGSVYPPAPENRCLVSVECQEHTMLSDLVENDDPMWPTQKALLLAPLEEAMEAARVQMAELYPFVGVEDYA